MFDGLQDLDSGRVAGLAADADRKIFVSPVVETLLSSIHGGESNQTLTSDTSVCAICHFCVPTF